MLYDTNKKYKNVPSSAETEIKDVLLCFDNKISKLMFNNKIKTHIKTSIILDSI
jgi:hypothetical protein